MFSASDSISRRGISSFSERRSRRMLAAYGLAEIYAVLDAALWTIAIGRGWGNESSTTNALAIYLTLSLLILLSILILHTVLHSSQIFLSRFSPGGDSTIPMNILWKKRSSDLIPYTNVASMLSISTFLRAGLFWDADNYWICCSAQWLSQK